MQKKPKTHQQVLQNIVILKSIYSKMIGWKLIIHLKLGLVVSSMKFSKEILLRTAKRIMLLINETFNLDTLIHNRANILHPVPTIQKIASSDGYVG